MLATVLLSFPVVLVKVVIVIIIATITTITVTSITIVIHVHLVLGKGDCDSERDCQGNLVCGKDNCQGEWFEEDDDCCVDVGNDQYFSLHGVAPGVVVV